MNLHFLLRPLCWLMGHNWNRVLDVITFDSHQKAITRDSGYVECRRCRLWRRH